MTEQEVQAYCANNGISVSPPGESLHVLDPTELPASVREFVNDDGSYKGDNTPEAEDSKEEPKELKGKLPDDFPGKSALEAEGYTTYAKVRGLGGDYSSVPGVGKATGEKIDNALQGNE